MIRLKDVFPKAECYVARSVLHWNGSITPTSLSDSYRIRVEYRLGKAPKTRVVEPELCSRDGRMPEHLYGDGSLCLYHPDYGEWNRGMLLVGTILPWASEWLLYYEVWLATGEWRGGGVHPPRKRKMYVAGTAQGRT
jgi:hypothetical protein